ncbi:unnamed protein product [Rhodiola kirilowii]
MISLFGIQLPKSGLILLCLLHYVTLSGSYLLEGPESNNSAGKMLTPDTNEGFELRRRYEHKWKSK